jgi:hypothetical protein
MKTNQAAGKPDAENMAEQGEGANIQQNTTNQGLRRKL